MPRAIIYRKRILQAVEAFMERTPSSYMKAHKIIRQCYVAINNEAKRVTLDDIIWSSFIVALTDSVYYENEKFLREIRETLLGHSSQTISRTIFGEDYRADFTADEAKWYAQLLELVDFLTTLPYAKIYEAAYQPRQDKESWESMRIHIPEVARAEKIDEEYQQRKILIEDLSAKNSYLKNIGDEKIYHLILREVTDLLTEIRVGKAAVYFGYPIVAGQHTSYRISTSSGPVHVNVTNSILWAKKMLDAISGNGELFISWRLSKAPTFDGDLLIISLH